MHENSKSTLFFLYKPRLIKEKSYLLRKNGLYRGARLYKGVRLIKEIQGMHKKYGDEKASGSIIKNDYMIFAIFCSLPSVFLIKITCYYLRYKELLFSIINKSPFVCFENVICFGYKPFNNILFSLQAFMKKFMH